MAYFYIPPPQRLLDMLIKLWEYFVLLKHQISISIYFSIF
jgi:hypothetical protein